MKNVHTPTSDTERMDYLPMSSWNNTREKERAALRSSEIINKVKYRTHCKNSVKKVKNNELEDLGLNIEVL